MASLMIEYTGYEGTWALGWKWIETREVRGKRGRMPNQDSLRFDELGGIDLRVVYLASRIV